jgi:hypothetical protein
MTIKVKFDQIHSLWIWIGLTIRKNGLRKSLKTDIYRHYKLLDSLDDLTLVVN